MAEERGTGCLEGMRCPGCGQTEEFLIVASSWFTVLADGTSEFGDVEWEDTSRCRCSNDECSWEGTVGEARR